MIVVRIYEGLGNQLFQYAAGRAVADRYGVELRIDRSWYDSDQGGTRRKTTPRRKYKLDLFHVEAPVATRRELAFHRSQNSPRRALIDRCLRLGSDHIAPRIRQIGRHTQLHRLDCGPDAYLDGYWQSERYFAPVAERLRREFRLRQTPDVTAALAQAAAWRQDATGPLVAVHVRRGDLVPVVKDGQLVLNHGPPTSAAFVREAMAMFPADSRFVVVTDFADRPWCRAHLGGPDVVYFDGTSDVADFAMLRACDHNVIANSTFSWWAAWLNESPDKRVVVPSPWFWPEDRPDRQNADLIPPTWTVLENAEGLATATEALAAAG